jgi:hypothetical protein
VLIEAWKCSLEPASRFTLFIQGRSVGVVEFWRPRRILVTCLLALLTTVSLGVAAEVHPSFRWATQSQGSNNFCYPNALGVDREHNSYITGRYTDETRLDWKAFRKTNFFHSPTGGFVAKYGAAGNLAWAVQAGDSFVEGRAIAVDANRNVYAVFIVHGQTNRSFDGCPVVTRDEQSRGYVLAKYDSNGHYVWAKQIAQAQQIETVDLATDGTGNCYWAGWIFLGATIGGKDIDYGAFVVKFDSDGNQTWIRRAIGKTGLPAFGLDSVGSVFLAGGFGDLIKIGTTNLVCAYSTNHPVDTYISKYSSSGQLLWVKQSGIDGPPSISRLSVDDRGNFSIIGIYRREVKFGKLTLDGNPTSACTFAAKYNSEGEVLWAQKICENDPRSAPWIASDGAGCTYATSTCSDDLFSIFKYDAGGNLLWRKPVAALDRGIHRYQFRADSAGYCYLAGMFSDPAVALDQFILRNDGSPHSAGQTVLAMLDTTSSPWQGMQTHVVRSKQPAGPPVFYMGSSEGFQSSPKAVVANSAVRNTVVSSNNVSLPTSRGKMVLHFGQK